VGDFFKTLAGKIASGAVALAVVAAALAWYETEPATKQAVLSLSGRILGWCLLMLVLPWASFPAIAWVNRLRSNGAGAALVLAVTVIDAVVLAWLFSWSLRGASEWVMYMAAVLIGGVYNLFSCDWIAEKTE
jgi:hypothetical protein